MFRTIDSSNYKYITERHLPGYVSSSNSSSNSPMAGSSTNPAMAGSSTNPPMPDSNPPMPDYNTNASMPDSNAPIPDSPMSDSGTNNPFA
jgi:hypothetical protein